MSVHMLPADHMLIFVGLLTVQDLCVILYITFALAHKPQIKLTKDGSVLLKEMVRTWSLFGAMLTEIANPKPDCRSSSSMSPRPS